MKTFYRVLLALLSPLKGLGFRDYAVVQWALGALKPGSVRINGMTLYLDRTDETISRNLLAGSYEPLETQAFKEFLKPGQVVLDIGANIGYYTTLFSRLVGAQGRVYAFEPTPHTFKILQKNVLRNRCENTRVFKAGLSDKSGEAKIYVNAYNKGDNRIYATPGMRTVPIRLECYDTFPPLAGQFIDVVKMDIQGAEVLALRGMRRMLERCKPLMIVEYTPSKLASAGTSADEFMNILVSLGYRFGEVDEEHGLRSNAVPEAELRAMGGKGRYTNVICFPPARTA